jgi:hypothetical protein
MCCARLCTERALLESIKMTSDEMRERLQSAISPSGLLFKVLSNSVRGCRKLPSASELYRAAAYRY